MYLILAPSRRGKRRARVTPAAAVKLIEDSETSLDEVDVAGVKSLVRDLGSLKKLLQKDEPDGEKVRALVAKLGGETSKIADRAENNGDKLRDFGKALEKAGC